MTRFTDQRADQRDNRNARKGDGTNVARFSALKDALLSPSERAELESAYGKVIGPLIDAKLEAKARELVERYRQSWLSTFTHIIGDTTSRDQLLVSREEAAELLGVSLSTVKRLEASDELPAPTKIGERIVRHRLVDIERLARVRKA